MYGDMHKGVINSMSSTNLILSDKYKAFIRYDAPVEFLEG